MNVECDAAGGGELPFFHSQVFMNSFLLALRVVVKPQKNNLQLCSEKTGLKLVEKRWSTIINICFSSPRFTITAAKIHPQWKSFQAPAHYRLCGVRDLSLRCDSWPAVQRLSTGEAVTYWFSLKSRNGPPASFLTNFYQKTSQTLGQQTQDPDKNAWLFLLKPGVYCLRQHVFICYKIEKGFQTRKKIFLFFCSSLGYFDTVTSVVIFTPLMKCLKH